MNLGMPEMIFLFVLALIIFGPRKLPEIGRQVGRALNEFKRASNEFKAQIETEISNLEKDDNAADSPTIARARRRSSNGRTGRIAPPAPSTPPDPRNPDA